MQRNRKVRGRDGAIRQVNDDYILRDGETHVVDLPFMDASRILVHDGRGQPAGQRPGFLYAADTDAATEAARVEAYAAYDAAICERWRRPPTKTTTAAEPNPPPSAKTFDSVEAARDAAYAQYRNDIQQRWQR